MPVQAATTFERRARDDIAPDHEFLREHLALLEEADDHVFGVLLTELLDYLPAHFAVEEKAGGLFDTVVREAPRLALTVEALRAEHGAIRDELRLLRSELARAPNAPSRALRAQVSELSERLREHEATEGLLLTDAVFSALEEGS
jgi:hemerythrin-like domain-containing protein